MLNDDYKDILRNFLKSKVRFLVVGAYAMAVYGYPRATGDFDIWVEASEENSSKIYKALVKFGSPLHGIKDNVFVKGIIFQIGVAPRRIDIITEIDGVLFSEAYKARKIVTVEGVKIPFLSKSDLIKNKKSTGREKDRIDVKHLLTDKGNS